MSFLSDAGRGLVRWTPKIVEATADDIAMFGPNAARVRALLNFIPTMSDDAVKISDKAWDSPFDEARRAARSAIYHATYDDAIDASVMRSRSAAKNAAKPGMPPREAAKDAAAAETISDLITPEVYRSMTNPMAAARALDRLAGRAPESFVPIARDLSERGLILAPSSIVSALRISKLPSQQQSLVTGLVDSGLTLEEAIAAARALS